MEYLYVDESGSMTTKYCDSFPYFVICTIRVKDPDKLRKRYKRFVSKYYNELKCLDEKIALRRSKHLDDKSRLFNDDGTLKELKGVCLDYCMKKAFVKYMCKKDFLEVIYIKIDNSKVTEKLYNNTARAFNYVYKLMLEHSLRNDFLSSEKMLIQFDERNQRTDCKASLEDYLNMELVFNNLSDEISVSYFDSSRNKIIQVADVLSNIFYSYCHNPEEYQELIDLMKERDCLKPIFIFPLA